MLPSVVITRPAVSVCNTMQRALSGWSDLHDGLSNGLAVPPTVPLTPVPVGLGLLALLQLQEASESVISPKKNNAAQVMDNPHQHQQYEQRQNSQNETQNARDTVEDGAIACETKPLQQQGDLENNTARAIWNKRTSNEAQHVSRHPHGSDRWCNRDDGCRTTQEHARLFGATSLYAKPQPYDGLFTGSKNSHESVHTQYSMVNTVKRHRKEKKITYTYVRL